MTRLLIPSWLCLLIVLSSCNFDAQPPEQTQPPPAVTIVAQVEPTNAPTLTPTPTIPPDVLLQVADAQLINGYYENALATYQSVVAQGASAPETLRATALFKMGQAALREGLFPQAVEALSAFLGQFPSDGRAGQAYFLRGDAHLGAGAWALAIADFQQYLALRPGLVDSYVHERIADAQLSLGQTAEALASYEQALSANRTLVPQLALREKVAQIYLSLGRVSDAIAQYDAILAVARNAPYRAQIEYAAGKALLDAGDVENALPRLRRVLNDYPTTASAYLAMSALVANGVQLDGFTRGKTAYHYGDYQGAIAAFNDYSTQYQLSALPAELHLLLGRAYREIGNPQAALVAFQTVIEQYPQDALFGAALLEQGRTRFLGGDWQGAIEAYIRIADVYGYLNETAAEALWRAGYLYGTNGNPTASRDIFLRLAETYPQSDWATNGLFIAASAAVNNQEWAIAENLYARLASLTTGENQSAAYLWVGRLALQRGDSQTAEIALQRATAAAPDSYYAARAADIRLNRAPFQPPARYQFQFDEIAELATAEAWMRQTFGITQEGDLWPLSAELHSDTRLIRARELWATGAYGDAAAEITSLLDESRANRDALRSYQLAIFLRTLGDYRQSIVAAADVIQMAAVPTLEAPSFIARLRYPTYYQEVVLSAADKYGLDPLLLFSLMRQESLFNATAVSVADARGLTQVIPSTGQYIANQLAWPDYQNSDLLRPYVSVEFGSYYLAEQLRLFDGNVAAALAAYNGGPGNALDWYALAGPDPDAFVTAITFEETRLYVQRIYSHYAIYRQLYGTDA